jgi:hypothetical protein
LGPVEEDEEEAAIDGGTIAWVTFAPIAHSIRNQMHSIQISIITPSRRTGGSPKAMILICIECI